MAREIDQRIVQMQFDNAKFERGVQTSIKSLNQLKKGLDFDGAVKGLKDLDKAVDDVKMNALVAAVDKLNSKFSLLGIMGVRALQRIADRAIDTGERLVKSLSVDQINAGWSKYEDKTRSVQTIMAATAKQFTDTGVQMQFVNSQLDKLNWFTDETSYNFTDMVNNIGKFTSNNIALDDSVTAMQGIANWAAISGANVNEASRAMYNISQAMSAGALKLQDWISIENANMGTAAFKEMAIESAIAAGTLIKSGEKIVTAGKKTEVSVTKFRDTLSEGWLSSNVLMDTLNNYGMATSMLYELVDKTGLTLTDLFGDLDDYADGVANVDDISKKWGMTMEQTQATLDLFQEDIVQFGIKALKAGQESKTFADAIDATKDAVSTGWMNTMQLLFGDYLEAKEFWTNITDVMYDAFVAGGDARNDLLKEWSDKGGRLYFIDTIYQSIAALTSVIEPVKAAWREIFTPMDADRLFNITKAIHSFVSSLVLNEDAMDKLNRTAKGLFAILDVIKTLVGGAVSKTFKLLGALVGDANLDILGFTANIGDALVGFRDWVKEATFLNDAMDRLIDIIAMARRSLSDFYNWFVNLPIVVKASAKILELYNAATADFAGFIENAGQKLRDFFASFNNGERSIRSIQDLKKVLGDFFTMLRDDIFNLELRFPNLMKAWDGLKRSIANGVKELISAFSALSPVTKWFGDIFFSLAGTIKDFLTDIDAVDIAVTLMGVGLWQSLKMVAGAFESISGAITGFTDLISGFQKSMDKYLRSKAIMNYAKALLILVGALALLTLLDQEKLKSSIVILGQLAAGFAAFAAVMVGAQILLNKFGGGGVGVKVEKNLTTIGVGILAMAAGIFLLAKAFDAIEPDNSTGGRLLLLGTLVAGLAGVAIALNRFAGDFKASAASILAFSAGIILLMVALKSLNKMDPQQLGKGFIALVGILAMFGLAIRLMNGPVVKSITGDKNIIRNSKSGAAAQILAFAVGIRVLIGAMKSLGKMDTDILGKGFISLGAVLLEIAVFVKILQAFSKNANLANVGGTILAIAVALNLIIPAIKGIAKIEPAVMKAAAENLAKIGLVFVAAIAASRFAGENAGKVGMMLLSMSVALALMPLIVKTIGKIDNDVLAKGIAAVSILMGMMSLAIAASKDAGDAKISIIAMIGVIAALSIAAYSLGQLDTKTLVSGVGGISVMLLAMAGAFKLLSSKEMTLKDDGKILASLAGMTAIVGLLAMVVRGFDGMENPTGAITAAGAVAVLLPVMALCIRLLNGVSELKKGVTKSLLGMTAVTGVLALVIVGLSQIPGLNTGQAIKMVGVVTALLGALVGTYTVIATLNKMGVKMTKEMTANFKQFAYIVGGASGVIAALALLPNADPIRTVKMVRIVGALLTELVATYAAVALLNKAKVKMTQEMTNNLLKFSGVVAAMAGIVAVLSLVPGDPFRAAAMSAGLAALLPSVAVTMEMVSKIKAKDIDPSLMVAFGVMEGLVGIMGLIIAALCNVENIEKALVVASALTVIIVPLALVMGELAKLTSIFKVGPDLIATAAIIGLAIDALVIVVGALVGLIGWIGSGPAGKYLEVAPHYAQLIGNAIGAFVGGIVEGAVGAVLNLLPTAGTKISEFVANIMPAFLLIGALPPGTAEKVKGFSAALIALTAAEVVAAIGTFVTKVFDALNSLPGMGENKTMSEKFQSLGEAIAAFAASLNGVNVEQVKTAAEATKILAGIESSLPGKGGKLQVFLGEQNLDDFAYGLEKLGEGVKSFADQTKDVDAGQVTNAANAAKLLVDLEKAVPAKGGKLQVFFGEHDIGAFGVRLTLFGGFLKAYALLVKDITKASVKGSADAASMLIDLESRLQLQGGFVQDLFGEKNFATFGSNLESFGSSLVSYIEQTEGISEADVEGSAAAIKALADVEKNLDTTGGFGALLFGDSSFSSFGDNLIDLGNALDQYDAKLSNVDLDQFQNGTEAIKELVSMAAIISNNGNWSADLKSAIGNWVAAIGQDISADADTIRGWGKDIIRWFVQGVGVGAASKDNISEAATATKTMATKTVEAFQTYMRIPSGGGISELFRDHGGYLAEGLIQGMEDKAPDVSTAGNNLARTVDDAFRATAGINSPAVTMIENGVWLVKGVAEGIKSDTSAEDAAAKKAQNISAAFQNALTMSKLYQERDSLAYQLWEANEGRYATDEEKAAKEIEYLVGDLGYQADEVSKLRGALDAMIKEFGAESKQAIEAENKMNQALVNLYKARNDIEQKQSELIQSQGSQVDKARAYSDLLNQDWVKNFQSMQGWTDEQIREWAKDETGFGRETKIPDLDLDSVIAPALAEQTAQIEPYVYEQAKKSVSSGVSGGVSAGLDEAAGGGSGNEIWGKFTEILGGDIDQGLANGITNGQKAVTDAIGQGGIAAKDYIKGLWESNSPSKFTERLGVDINQGLANGITESTATVTNSISAATLQHVDKFQSMGVSVMSGFTLGIVQQGQAAIDAAERVANRVSQVMAVTLAIHSPSKVTDKLGQYVALGLAKGITDNAYQVEYASQDLANTTISAMDYAKTAVNNVLQADDDFVPTITPVLDLDQLKQQAGSIGGILNRQNGITTRLADVSANAIAKRVAEEQDAREKKSNEPSSVTYDFVQNNYSPKALNRKDIYRQTRNQFAQLKGAAKR